MMEVPSPALSIALPVRRPACATCLRSQSTCICKWITQIPHTVEVLILQHPLEVANAKGSARLLHLSLPGSTLKVGEVFDFNLLAAIPKQNLLLYPETPFAETRFTEAPVMQAGLLADPAQLRLIVLDATWRKSRKMLYLNPQLQQLPRMALKNVGASNYSIRKAHGADQLSTLEATCAALIELERDAGKYQPLLKAFDGFVAQQAGLAASGRLGRPD